MKKAPLTLLLLGLASLAIATQDPSLITVTGEGQVVVPPDYADITLGVTLTAPTAQEASDQVDKISSDIIAYLQEKGIADQDIQTSYVSVSPVINYGTPVENEVPSFTATKTVDFTLRDLSKYDEVIQGLFAIGANTINNVEWRANDTDEKVETAKSRAAQNARDIAENLARSLGVGVGAVFSISDQTSGGYYPIAYDSAAQQEEGSSGSAGPSVAGGVITISASVQVQFFIVQKDDNNYSKDVSRDETPSRKGGNDYSNDGASGAASGRKSGNDYSKDDVAIAPVATPEQKSDKNYPKDVVGVRPAETAAQNEEATEDEQEDGEMRGMV